MAIPSPDIGDIRKAFPELQNLIFLQAGGFKSVYKTTINGNFEALKLILLPELKYQKAEEKEREYAELKRRISREIEILRKVTIPELVKLGSIPLRDVQINGKEYMAYSEEFIDGMDLMQIISSNAERPIEQELKALFLTILNVIKILWGMGYIHCDIKPANIMKTNLTERPFVVMDLGIAFSINETGITNNTAAIPGTLKYVAPEMLSQGFRQTIDFRSDLYAAGLTVYEYAAFRHPLAREADDVGTTLMNTLKKIPKSLKEQRKDLSTEFCSIVNQLLKKKPALRPSNIDLLISKMESAL